MSRKYQVSGEQFEAGDDSGGQLLHHIVDVAKSALPSGAATSALQTATIAAITAVGVTAIAILAFMNAISAQNPLSADGDSVYVKDVWLAESTSAGFTGGDVTDLVDNLHSVIVNTTSDNPKTILVHFERTVVSNAIGLGSYGGGDFSNVKIEIGTSGDVFVTVIDDSGDNTKLTSETYQLPITAGFNALRITFHTADTITLSNLVVLKSESGVVRLQAAKPDNTVTDINATAGGNLKVALEEYDDSLIDAATGLPVFVSHAEESVHAGESFFMNSYVELDDTDTFCMKLVTPDTTTWAHFSFNISTSGILYTTFDEDATGGMTGGASVTPINSNRNSAETSVIVLTGGVTAATGYTTRLENRAYGGTGFKADIGGGETLSHGLILKQDTVYIRCFLSGSDANIVSFRASWDESADQ